MNYIEKETILYQIEVLKNYVKRYYELPEEEPTKFKKLIERLKWEARDFKKLYDNCTRKAEESTDKLTKTYHDAKSDAYDSIYKTILLVVKDFDGTDM